jgi:hypothetical protein
MPLYAVHRFFQTSQKRTTAGGHIADLSVWQEKTVLSFHSLMQNESDTRD